MLGHRTLNVEDYLTMLRRRWWIIAIPALILPVVGYAVSYLIPPQYVSQTLVLINQQKVPEDFVKPVVAEDLNSRLASMKEQIESRNQLEPIIKKYNLYESSRTDMDQRIELARKAIDIQPIRSEIRSNGLPGFKIFFTASDPQTAQQVCQEITSLFTGANVRLREEAAKGTTDFLRQQLTVAKQNLDDQDQKLAAFKRQYVGMLPEDTTNNTNILTTLNSRLDATTTQLNNLQQNKTMAESMLAQQTQAYAAQFGQTAGSSARAPGTTERELQTLQAQESDMSVHYTDAYPALKRVRGRIAELQKQLAKEAAEPAPPPTVSSAPRGPEPASIQQLRTQIKIIDSTILQKRKEQEQVDAQIRGYQSRIQSSPQVEEQEKELTRDYTTTLDSYNALKAKLDASTMATELEHQQQGETFSLLDAANLPETPTWPKRPLFAGGGLAAGLAFGLLIVALLEYQNTALRSERDVWAFTQLPTLAIIAWAENELPAKKRSLFARLFRRKGAKDELADAAG